MPRSLRRPAAAAATLLALALAGCTTEDGGDTATDPGPAETTQSTTETPTATAAGDCDYPADGAPAAKEVQTPPATPVATGDVEVTITLDTGDVTATLDGAGTPCTVNSFLSLADQGYFDGTTCHRLTTQGIFVLQCGDPSATGMGGPGYSFPDELSGTETYPAGTLAMANAGPDTNGSQFFIVYQDTELSPAYTVFGQIDPEGVEVVQDIAAEGTADGGGDGAPKNGVTIESVTQG